MDALICESVLVGVLLTVVLPDDLTVTGVVVGGCPVRGGAPSSAVINYNE